MGKHKIFRSKPYESGEMGSFGNAAYMLIRQFQYPVSEYDDSDKLLGDDSDRCFQWDYNHCRRCFTEHTGTGELNLESWVRSSNTDAIIAFLKDILKADESDPAVIWTGFRIMGSVHRGNGYPVWTLELFAKAAGSDTEVTDQPHETTRGRGKVFPSFGAPIRLL